MSTTGTPHYGYMHYTQELYLHRIASEVGSDRLCLFDWILDRQ